MQWIDSHIHLFTAQESTVTSAPPFVPENAINTPALYLRHVSQHPPKGVVVVDFSRAEDPAHVVNSLDALHAQGMPAKGIVRGNVHDEQTHHWLQRDDIAGIRLYAVANIPNLAQDKAKWDRIFNTLRHRGQHILVYGVAPYLRKLIEQLPEDIPLLIDHLGMPKSHKGASDPEFQALLSLMAARARTAAPVYFKGPGYRTALSPHAAAPFVADIIHKLGTEAVLLGASDAPFAGPASDTSSLDHGKPHASLFDYHSVMDYVEALAQETARLLGTDEKALSEQLLYKNAADLYGFAAN
tara:strand:- start:205 stop:1098 length:894 start_codon:yes stop_codon:yes gene_type:complete